MVAVDGTRKCVRRAQCGVGQRFTANDVWMMQAARERERGFYSKLAMCEARMTCRAWLHGVRKGVCNLNSSNSDMQLSH